MNPIQLVHSDAAPAAIGAYSQAVVHNGLVYCSGQVALDPKSGEMVGSTAATQAEQALQNLSAVLGEAGSSLGRTLKVTIFLVDMADFGAVNEVYARHLGDHRPARACVAAAALPKGALVEVDCIAAVGAP